MKVQGLGYKVGRCGGEEGLKGLLKEEMVDQLYPDGARRPVGPLVGGKRRGRIPERGGVK